MRQALVSVWQDPKLVEERYAKCLTISLQQAAHPRPARLCKCAPHRLALALLRETKDMRKGV